ncbi:MAG: hypothetical protein IKY47_04960, partial [Bacteroidaceae bacterium]|nr:hypothetical protein [Bacteroidaceae bacterium]
MKDISKETFYGIIGTLVFHILVAVLLCLIVMEQIPVQPEKSNIEMQSAAEDFAGKEFYEAKFISDVKPQVAKAEPAPATPAKDPYIAQNYEKSIPVDTLTSKVESKKEKPTVSEEERKRKEEAERKAAEEAARRAAEEAERQAKEKIANSVAGTFGKSSKISSKSGDDAGVGAAGSTEGGTDQGLQAVGAGNGLGIDYKVGNRRVVGELNRNIPVQEAGTVIVNVTVDPQGRVV